MDIKIFKLQYPYADIDIVIIIFQYGIETELFITKTCRKHDIPY